MLVKEEMEDVDGAEERECEGAARCTVFELEEEEIGGWIFVRRRRSDKGRRGGVIVWGRGRGVWGGTEEKSKEEKVEEMKWHNSTGDERLDRGD